MKTIINSNNRVRLEAESAFDRAWLSTFASKWSWPSEALHIKLSMDAGFRKHWSKEKIDTEDIVAIEFYALKPDYVSFLYDGIRDTETS